MRLLSEKISFEIHITVELPNSADVNTFTQICSEVGGKSLLIELAKGENPQQLMMSKCVFKENLEKVLEICKDDCAIFALKGFFPNRVKIEVDFNFADLFPEKSRRKYFEWHGKIELEFYEKLLEICRKHTAHISKNSLKGESGFRFITLRENGEKSIFENRVFSLIEDLQKYGWEIVKQESEFCVFDSNISLDKGWLEK